jgi:uncharacterized protein (TIGR03086 family)
MRVGGCRDEKTRRWSRFGDHGGSPTGGWLPDGTPLIVDDVEPSVVGDHGVWFLDALDDANRADLPAYLVINPQGRMLERDDRVEGGDQTDPLVREVQQPSFDELIRALEATAPAHRPDARRPVTLRRSGTVAPDEGGNMESGLMATAIEGFEERLGAVGATEWTAATLCDDWDVRTLVNHVVGELLWMPPLLEGKTIAEVGDRFDGDVLGSDPLATYKSAAAGAHAAAFEPGAQERTVHLSFGDFPGSEYVGQVVSDVVIHTWDLARAIGADDQLDPVLVTFVDQFLGPQIEAWRGAGAFGPAVEVGADAGVQDRLLAQTGRSPAWTASAD